ncbi:MAG TPA: hypothetical protein VF189_03060, partial [Patescibacteria group bacterium]
MLQVDRKPLRLSYLDPKTGFSDFVKDGQAKRMYGLSGQALLKAVEERMKEPKTLPEKRRREKYGGDYLEKEIKLAGKTATTLGQRLLDRIDKYSGEAIAKNYEGVNKYQADDFYKRRMLDANNFVSEFTNILFPSVVDIVRLNNDVRLISSKRSKILGILLNNPIDKHLFFEVQRHLVLSNIAAELSERSRTLNINAQVNDVQDELSTNLFKPPFGYTEFAETYAKIDPSTNSVVSVYEA